ncbi:MAG: thiamine-monophosphate kinase [Opitutales bacterium]|nr:thiamine-monophosphate kinase [Opitutales bacterium]
MHPFSKNPQACAGNLGECKLLEHIHDWLGESTPPSPYGMGDDTAVLQQSGNLLTTDSLVYNKHFDDGAHPEAVGYKLLARNLSDIASMGGTPLHAVTAFFMPANTSLEWLEGFTRGLGACAQAYGVKIVGGDLTGTDGFLGATLTLDGIAERPLLRGRVKAGDLLYVTGNLGGSISGKHLNFIPRLKEGRQLARYKAVSGCMDITDGLGKDLPGFLSKGLAAQIDLNALPISEAAREQSGRDGRSIEEHAFCDGEDYELLFSVEPTFAEQLEGEWKSSDLTPIRRIGVAVEQNGSMVLMDRAGNPLPHWHGYEHLGKS